MMKRIFALLLCAATLLTSLVFTGCDLSSDKKKKEKEEDKGQYITAYLSTTSIPPRPTPTRLWPTWSA